MSSDFNSDDVVRDVTAVLRQKFPDVDPLTVEAFVREEVTDLEQRPVRDYISVLAQREAKRRLKNLS